MIIDDASKAPDDEAPTKPEDWIGASVVRPSIDDAHEIEAAVDNRMIFQVFRSSKDHELFAITDADNCDPLPDCPDDGNWMKFKKFPETGKPRIGYSEIEVKKDIEKKGYHLNRVHIDVSEGTISTSIP